MTTKFDSQATRALYESDPDDTYGSSLDGFSWFGLYRTSENETGGFIVVEDTYGFVTRVDFETDAALSLAWDNVTSDPDNDYYAVNNVDYILSGVA